MLKIAIVDDEAVDREQILFFIVQYSVEKNMEIKVCKFSSAEEFLDCQINFDIIFMDVLFKNGMNGINAGIILRKRGIKSVLIFISSSREYSIKGYEAKADKYILKPLKYQDVYSSIEAVLRRQTRYIRFGVKTTKECHYFNIYDIEWIKSQKNNRTKLLHLYGEEKNLETWESLSDIYIKLPGNIFCYIQRGCIINMIYVSKLVNHMVQMSSGTQFKIGRNYYKTFIESYHEFLEVQRYDFM